MLLLATMPAKRHANHEQHRGFVPRKRSPVTLPEFRRGVSPPNKGRKLPAEVLMPHEVKALIGSFGDSVTGVRNRAIVMLLYHAGLKVAQVVALERRHYEPGSRTITAPSWRGQPERVGTLDSDTRAALDQWMKLRRQSGVRVTAPLFCTVSAGTKGNPLHTAYLRNMLKDKANELGIDRRCSCEGLRRSGVEHRKRSLGRVPALLSEYVDDDSLRSRYQDAFERLESALDLFVLNPVRHATRIGHDCREAMLTFVDTALVDRSINAPENSGTVSKLRLLVAAAGPQSETVAAHLKAIITYWGSVSDLAQRQEHAAAREGDELRGDDARRLVAHTLLVMSEVDRGLFTLAGNDRAHSTRRKR